MRGAGGATTGQDGLSRVGLGVPDLGTPPHEARTRFLRPVYVATQAALALLVLASTALTQTASWTLAGVVALRLVVLAGEAWAGVLPVDDRPRSPARYLAQAAFVALAVLAARGRPIEVVAVVVLVPVVLAGGARPSEVRRTGLATSVGALAVLLADVLADQPRAGNQLLSSLALIVVATTCGVVVAEARRSLSDRAERLDASRRRLLADGLLLDERDRRDAAAAVERGARTAIAAARTALGARPPDLVGARRELGVATGALREVVAELHPVARRQRDLGDRLRATLERRLEADAKVVVAGGALAEDEEELVLAVAREVADAARRAGVTSGVHARVTGTDGRVTLLVDLPLAHAAFAPAWAPAARLIAEAGGRVALATDDPERIGVVLRLHTAPVGVPEQLSSLTLVRRRSLAPVLAATRLAFLAAVWAVATASESLTPVGAAVGAVAAAAFVAGLVVAAGPGWRRYPVGWQASLVEVVLLCLAVALLGGGSTAVGHLLPLLPVPYVWVFGRHWWRLVATLAAGYVLAVVLTAALADQPLAARHAGAVLLALAATTAVAWVTDVARARLQRRLVALDSLQRGLLADALRAADEERRRLAFGLHDGALQTLLSSRQDLGEALVAGLPAAAAPALAGLARAERELDAALDGDVVAMEASLEDALAELLADAGARGRLTTELRVDPEAVGRADDLVRAVAAELLTNVVRHAGASHVSVALRAADDGALLEVRDDGRGVAAPRLRRALREGHVGLASCQARAEAAGGRLELHRPPEGTGTLARLVAPAAAPGAWVPSGAPR